MQQHRSSTTPEMSTYTDDDPYAANLPREVKPIQSIVWAFIAIGVVGLLFALAVILYH